MNDENRYLLDIIRTLGRLLDDLEAERIRLDNRIRSLEQRYGEAMPHLHAVAEPIHRAEHLAQLELVRAWRRHPLAPWAKAQRGVGEKSIARLVAEVGDPAYGSTGHWETTDGDGAIAPASTSASTPLANGNGAARVETESTGRAPRRRTWVVDDYYERGVAQLWAYCGLGDPARSKIPKGAVQEELLKRGKPRAKKQMYLIGTGMLKAGNREVYDTAREHYSERVHAEACAPCHAKAGDPWKDGHKHMAALRKVEKEFLKDLWHEARRIHDL